MSEQPDHFLMAWWADNLDTLDHEIARLATLCGVKVLDPGVISRVLQSDPAVCATPNPKAFSKLRDLLMMHMAIRQKSVDTVGQAQTAAIEDYVIERVRKHFPDVLGKWPPA